MSRRLADIVSGHEVRGLSHAEALKLILSRSPSPLTIRQMAQILEQAGRKLSKNGYRILYKTLRRHETFQAVSAAWWIARV